MKKLLILLTLLMFSFPSIVIATGLTDAQKISLYVMIIKYCDQKYPTTIEKFLYEKNCRRLQLDACMKFFNMKIHISQKDKIMQILEKHGFTNSVFYDTIDWISVLYEIKNLQE